MINDSIHPLQSIEIAFLNRGPTYVSPLQLHLWSTPASIQQWMLPLRRKLDRLFTYYSIDQPVQVEFEQALERLIEQCFSVPIPLALEERSYFEKKIVQSILDHLENHNLILRRMANDQNVFYLGNRTEFRLMIKKYLPKSINTNAEVIVQTIENEIEQWYKQKWIKEEQWLKIKLNTRKHRLLPTMYFLPKIKHVQQDIVVQPRLSSFQHGPLVPMANYLYGILQPLFETSTQATTAPTHRHLIQRLQRHCASFQSFHSTTHFVSFHLKGIYHRMEHARMLVALHKFLQHPTVQQSELPLNNEMLERIAAFILQQQWFLFEGNYYRYTKGGFMNVPLIQLLADIYIQDWQSSLVRQIRLIDAFYCRYHQDGLFTWTDATRPVNDHFQSLLEQYPDLQAKVTIGQHIHFLDAVIVNRFGRLYTSVYRAPEEQLFLLPFVTDYSRIQYRQWFRFAMIRATLYCTQLADFEQERLYIECSLLANGYALEWIEQLQMEFFRQFPFLQQDQPLTPHYYTELRRRLARQLEELETEARDQYHHERCLEFTYRYDWGHRCQFNEEFQHLWSRLVQRQERLQQSNFKIVLKPKYLYSANTLFAFR